MSWPRGRQRDGGIDRITLPAPGDEGPLGELWVCGKHVVAPDPEGLRARIGSGTTIVSFNEAGDIARYEGYAEWLRASPDALWFPVPDFHAPDVEAGAEMVEAILDRLRRPAPVVLHCSAGLGRAGTMAVAVLVATGVEVEPALDQVRAERPGAGPQAGVQLDFVLELAELLGR